MSVCASVANVDALLVFEGAAVVVTRVVMTQQSIVRATYLYDTIGEFNVDSKAEYSALSSARSQKKI